MAATEWLDYYPLVQSMQCIVDGGYGTNPPDVEAQCQLLESFEVPVANSYPQQPPIVVVKGPVFHTELFWVCSRLSFDGGDGGQIRNAAGLRTQQHFTIELTQYSPSSGVLTGLTSAQAAQSLPSTSASGLGIVQASGVTYTVVAGDTLWSIAARLLGNAGLWTQIAILNGLSNSALLYPGQVLQMPAV
jgi:LysM repeat protein